MEKLDSIDCKVLGFENTEIRAELKTLQKANISKIDIIKQLEKAKAKIGEGDTEEL